MKTENLIPNFLNHKDNPAADHKQTTPDPQPQTTPTGHDLMHTPTTQTKQTQPLLIDVQPPRHPPDPRR